MRRRAQPELQIADSRLQRGRKGGRAGRVRRVSMGRVRRVRRVRVGRARKVRRAQRLRRRDRSGGRSAAVRHAKRTGRQRRPRTAAGFEVARSRIPKNSGRCGGRGSGRPRPNSWDFGHFRLDCATSTTAVVAVAMMLPRTGMFNPPSGGGRTPAFPRRRLPS